MRTNTEESYFEIAKELGVFVNFLIKCVTTKCTLQRKYTFITNKSSTLMETNAHGGK